MHACFAGRGDGDAFDKTGHGHFDVEFDHVSEGMELNVSVTRLVNQLAPDDGTRRLTQRSLGST